MLYYFVIYPETEGLREQQLVVLCSDLTRKILSCLTAQREESVALQQSHQEGEGCSRPEGQTEAVAGGGGGQPGSDCSQCSELAGGAEQVEAENFLLP